MKLRLSVIVIVVMAFFALQISGMAEEPQKEAIDCTMCHGDLATGKVVHAAVLMGCTVCHSGVDASQIPHKFTTNFPKGLPSEIADICYNCHDKAKFYGPTVHAPVGIGLCTACHNPHHSENEKLLSAGKEAICYNCHEQEKFSGKKVIHDPVRAGLCLECHVPHASSNEYLTVSKGNLLCRKCHPRVEKEPHAIVGLSQQGHPVKGKSDPKRKGKTFECLSCHVPHASDWGRLFRYKAESSFDLCTYCHEI